MKKIISISILSGITLFTGNIKTDIQKDKQITKELLQTFQKNLKKILNKMVLLILLNFVQKMH